MEASVVDMSKAIASYFDHKKKDPEEGSGLKFHYIWQNLDNLFKQMAQADINELNLKFLSLAIEKINKEN